jgi:hypothetical protein
MLMYIFLWVVKCSYIFIVRVEVIEIVNLIWIQIGLEFRKDLKNKKPFLIFLLAMGRNPPAGPTEPTPASLTCSQGSSHPLPHARL